MLCSQYRRQCQEHNRYAKYMDWMYTCTDEWKNKWKNKSMNMIIVILFRVKHFIWIHLKQLGMMRPEVVNMLTYYNIFKRKLHLNCIILVYSHIAKIFCYPRLQELHRIHRSRTSESLFQNYFFLPFSKYFYWFIFEDLETRI